MVSALTANVISAYLECTLYGIFLVLAATVLSIWLRQRASGGPGRNPWCTLILDLRHSPLVLANLFFLVTITAHWIVGIHRLLLGTVHEEDTRESNAFFADLHETTEVVRSVLLFLDIVVADLIMTYRTWIVWGRKPRVIIFPAIVILGLLASCAALVYEFIAATPEQSVYTTKFRHWVIGFCSATLVTNAYGTGMITYRIWRTTRLWKKCGRLASAGRSDSRILEALEIFIESAALYSVWFALFLALYVARSPLQAVGSGCSPAIAGISFMLIAMGARLGLCGSGGGGGGDPCGSTGAPKAFTTVDFASVRFGNASGKFATAGGGTGASDVEGGRAGTPGNSNPNPNQAVRSAPGEARAVTIAAEVHSVSACVARRLEQGAERQKGMCVGEDY